MTSINFPEYDFKLRIVNDQKQIFDPVRKKYVKLTPEEWVRQHWIYYLHGELNFPFGYLAVEKGLELNQLKKRCDIVAYSRAGEPMLIVECKAPEVKVNQQSIDQAGRYNIKLKVPYLLISNGADTAFFFIDHKKGTFHEMQKIPLFDNLSIESGENS
ncbi:MAG: type I restriction enzyme HsdR N-terminal domain-containing protein [Chitinophagales bacterium]